MIKDEPARPRSRHRQVPDELEAVCLKALEKEIARRYRGAGDLAADLRRWLRGEPVEARRPGIGFRAWRKAVRYRWAVAAAGIVAVALAGVAGATWGARVTEAHLRAMGEQVEATVARFEDAVMQVEMNGAARGALARQPLDSLNGLIEHDPSYGPYHSWRGEIHRLLGEMAEAERDYDRGCALSPGEAIVWYLRGAYRIQRYVDARGLPGVTMDAAGDLTFAPGPEETRTEQAWRAGGMDDLARIAESGRVDPRIGAERIALGKALLALHAGTADGSAQALVLLERPRDPQSWRIRGVALYQAKRFEEAEAAFGRTVALWKEDAFAWCMRGECTVALGIVREPHGGDVREACRQAIGWFGEALRRQPESGPRLHDRGRAQRTLGVAEAAHGQDPRPSFGKAIADFDASLRIRPGSVTADLSRSRVYAELGKAEAAVGHDAAEAYARASADAGAALNRDPESADAHNARAFAALGLGEAQSTRGQDPGVTYGQAIADLDSALARRPTFAEALVNRGLAQQGIGGHHTD